MTTRIAIAHDQFRTMGGAERVAVEMARTLDCPIFAARVDDEVVPDDVDVREVFGGRLASRAMRSHYLVQDAFQMLAWQHVPDLHECDVVILNKTNPSWYVPRDTQTVVWYLHSTPRGLYDQFPEQGAGLVTAGIKAAMRALYETNRTHPDIWLCNSELVQRRLEAYSGVPRTAENSRVVHPPVDTAGLSPDIAPTQDYYLALGRLRDHKRIHECIRACAAVDAPLHVVGEGPEREALESLADRLGADVTFHGYVSEAKKARLLAGARALLMTAENEDFGLTPIEALASGTPVIGVREGYTRHQIEDGDTGVLYDREDGLDRAIERFESMGITASPADLAAVAAQCSTERFREELRQGIHDAVERSRVTADWSPPEPEVAGRDRVAADGGGDPDE